MKKMTMPLAVAALVALYAGTASAQCAFDIAPAKGVKGSMVRNYAPCPGTESLGVTTSETEGGTESCAPVYPYKGAAVAATLYSYGPKGKCDVQTKATLVADCSTVTNGAGDPLGLGAAPCHVTYVKSKCSDILGTDGLSPIDGNTDTGWTLATLTRATFDDASNGDMTVIDFPVTFQFGTPKKGKIILKANSAEVLKPMVGVANADLPACTSLEIVDVTIKAPGGLPFAKLGGATLPEAP